MIDLGTVRKIGSVLLICVGVLTLLLTILMNWGDLLQMCGDRAITWVINLLVGIFSIEIGILGIKGWNFGGVFAIIIGVGEIIGVILVNIVLSGVYFHVYGFPALGIELLLYGLKWEMVIIIVGGILILAGGSDYRFEP